MKLNDLTSCICDMYDIRNSILRAGLGQSPKDNEGSEIPLIDCVDDVLEILGNEEAALDSEKVD